MKKKRDNRANKIIRNKKINKFIIIGVIVVAVLIISFAVTNIKFSSNANAALPIDGIKCEAMEQTIWHIHAKLAIFINGQNYTVPALIGITNHCFYWLHTHDQSGIIHIESPINRTYHLGEFFDIWKQKLSNNQILNHTANSANPLNTYINGTKVPNGTNYRDIPLHAHDVITIVYGKPPSSIPAKADFSAVDAP
jgi:hypothetical protein